MKMSKNSGKILWGVFFLLAAVYVVASKLWILPDVSVFTVLWTVFFAWILICGIRKLNFWEILFPIAFLCILYDDELGITAITPWTVLGAALLGSIGLSLIFKGKKRKKNWDIEFSGNDKIGVTEETVAGGKVHFENNFGETIKYVNCDDFHYAELENNFGELTVYFDNAIIQSGRARIEVDNNFGETNLYIPKEWKTQEDFSHFMGNIASHGRAEGSSAQILEITGGSNFGEVNIYYI